MRRTTRRRSPSLLARSLALTTWFVAGACAHPRTTPNVVPASATARAPLVDGAGQLVLVTTPEWNATTGTLRRFARDASGAWRAVGDAVPVVVGRTGLAWDDAITAPAGEPRKREGDGKSPAGMFPVDTAFGFSPTLDVRLPYLPLAATHECVDDGASVHYNTVVDRARVPRVDWSSAEKMRSISVYRVGAIVGYNAPPRAGRGSCIFLHVWDGPASVTAGCTAMDERALRAVLQWLDPRARPVVVQLTEGAYRERRGEWKLP